MTKVAYFEDEQSVAEFVDEVGRENILSIHYVQKSINRNWCVFYNQPIFKKHPKRNVSAQRQLNMSFGER